DSGIRSADRSARAAARHHRARRRCLYDAHPLDRFAAKSCWEESRVTTTERPDLAVPDRYKFGWADSDIAGESARRGINEEVVRDISAKKNEPEWMLEQRLKGLKLFFKKPMPTWGADLSAIDFDNIKYFVRST